MAFQSQLRRIGFPPKEYLRVVRQSAYHNGYNPARLDFADNDTHKLAYTTPEGKVVRFGRVGYGDYHIWTFLERKGQEDVGYAEQKRHTFVKSHSAMTGAWRTNDYSPNWLAIRILWD